MNNFREKANFIWSVADLLRGDYKRFEYGKVILPFTILRRLDGVLSPTKAQVMAEFPKVKDRGEKAIDLILNQAAGYSFHNHSPYDLAKLLDDPANIAANLRNYISGFSGTVREIFDYFLFEDQIKRLDDANLLFLIVQKFNDKEIDLTEVDPLEMGYIFEELIRKFSEISNETAGEHFTPREVIELMVNVLFTEDDASLSRDGIVRTLYDPACGTGGMLSIAERHLKSMNEGARLELFGQELNDESYAICKSDMLIKGQRADNIKRGNSFTQDGLEGEKFDYMLSNPPFGVEWKKVATEIKNEYEKRGFAGRFGAGLPRISDGSLLFLQHMISKLKPEEGGRIGIVLNGSPLFTGGAEGGESEIRRWIIENDWLEAIIALPDQLFYNTGISTYVWIVCNRKSAKRKGKVQLINAVDLYAKMSKSLGNKRHYITPEQITEITRMYGEFQESDSCKIFDNEDFGYHRITVERPLRLSFQASPERIAKLEDEKGFQNLAKSKKKGAAGQQEIQEGQQLQQALRELLAGLDAETLYRNRDQFVKVLKKAANLADLKLSASMLKMILSALGERDEKADICRDKQENPEPDTDLRDYENIPLTDDIEEYFAREVLPHVPDAWIDHDKTKIGYEISFTRYFYQYKPLRSLTEIQADILALEEKTHGRTKEIIS